MTRKDYILIAEAIEPVISASHFDSARKDGARRVAVRVAAALSADNPRFDRERFLKACGVTP